jgi:hypothetical protein
MQLWGTRDRRLAEQVGDKSEGGARTSLSKSYDGELSQISACGERAASQRILESFVPIPIATRFICISMKLISYRTTKVPLRLSRDLHKTMF